MKKFLCATAMLAGSALTASATTLDESAGYLLAANGQSIVVINDLGAPSEMREISLTGGTIDALSYRPRTGQLYGYSVGSAGDEDDKVYEINISTGALTDTTVLFGTGVGGIANNGKAGFDFNNSLDAARVVSNQDDNLVFFPSDTASGNPNAGGVIRATDLFYAAGDVNEGVNPLVVANAYTNAVDGQVASTTLQFAIDANRNVLTTLANNAGTLTTVGALGLDVTINGGFEILSESEGDNLGVALLRERDGNSGLFTIDLDTGAATLFADLGPRNFLSFAAQTESPAPVPLPSSVMLLLAGLGGLGLMKRRTS